MTNFEKYINELDQTKFIQSMILNCDGCPAYPCEAEGYSGTECMEALEDWCEKPFAEENKKLV